MFISNKNFFYTVDVRMKKQKYVFIYDGYIYSDQIKNVNCIL